MVDCQQRLLFRSFLEIIIASRRMKIGRNKTSTMLQWAIRRGKKLKAERKTKSWRNKKQRRNSTKRICKHHHLREHLPGITQHDILYVSYAHCTHRHAFTQTNFNIHRNVGTLRCVFFSSLSFFKFCDFFSVSSEYFLSLMFSSFRMLNAHEHAIHYVGQI